MVTSALWSDVDGDGWPDLLVTLEWGNVSVFITTRARALKTGLRIGICRRRTGWWTSIAAADFNGDGRPDYVVGNVGLNTPYHAEPQHPALLFSGDFRGDGSTQLIEASYEGDRLYPLRIVRDVGAVIPSVLKRYPRFDLYGRATLGEIFGRTSWPRPGASPRQSSERLFLSQPDGTYRFEPCPELRKSRRCRAWPPGISMATATRTFMPCRTPTRRSSTSPLRRRP